MSDAAAGMSALGGLLGYKGNQAAARAAERTAEFNATLAENEAVLLERAKVDEERAARRNASRLIAQATTATAASGIEMSGSPMLALADSYFQLEKDALRIQYASDIEQTQKQSQADLTRAEGRGRAAGYKMASYQSLLSGGEKAGTLMS